MDGCNAARKRVKSKLRISLSLSLSLSLSHPLFIPSTRKRKFPSFSNYFLKRIDLENYESSIFL